MKWVSCGICAASKGTEHTEALECSTDKIRVLLTGGGAVKIFFAQDTGASDCATDGVRVLLSGGVVKMLFAQEPETSGP